MVVVLRVTGVQDTWWEVLPEQAQQLPAELARIDVFLVWTITCSTAGTPPTRHSWCPQSSG